MVDKQIRGTRYLNVGTIRGWQWGTADIHPAAAEHGGGDHRGQLQHGQCSPYWNPNSGRIDFSSRWNERHESAAS